jgi:hypothetical protein
VRETQEQTGLDVAAVKLLGERIHPKTGRLMSYTACQVVDGTAYVSDTEDLVELAWVALADAPTYVPYGLFELAQHHLDATLMRLTDPGMGWQPCWMAGQLPLAPQRAEALVLPLQCGYTLLKLRTGRLLCRRRNRWLRRRGRLTGQPDGLEGHDR